MVQLPAEVSKQLDSFLVAPDVVGLAQMITNSVNDVSRNDISKAMVQYVADKMSAASAARGASFVVTIADCIDGVAGLHTVTFAADYCQLEMVAATCCATLKAFKEAVQLDARLLRAPSVETNLLTQPQRLALAQRAMQCAMEIDDPATGDLAAKFGAPAFRHLTREAAVPGAEVAGYLGVLALSLVARGRFMEAARAAYQRQLVTRDARDLTVAVCCAILAGAGPARASLLNLLHATAEVAELGPVVAVLERAHASLLLEEADMNVVVKSLDVRVLHTADVHRSLVEHNMEATSRFYDNIHIETLCRLLGGLTQTEAVDIVVEMVRSGRLVAKVDEYTGLVFFRVMESKSALEEWDGRIGSICNSVSYAGNLIAKYRPDLYAYAQSTKTS